MVNIPSSPLSHQWLSQGEASFTPEKTPPYPLPDSCWKRWWLPPPPWSPSSKAHSAAPVTYPGAPLGAWKLSPFSGQSPARTAWAPDFKSLSLRLFTHIQVPTAPKQQRFTWNLRNAISYHSTHQLSLESSPLPSATKEPKAFTKCWSDDRPHCKPSSLPASQWVSNILL